MQVTEQGAEQVIQWATATLRERYDCLRCSTGDKLPPTLTITPGLDPEEAKYFLLGLQQGIYSIDNEGYVQSPLLPHSSKRETKKRVLQLFWHVGGKRVLFREGICQLATLSELVLKHQWPPERIQMEPTFPEFRHLSNGVDMLLKNEAGIVVACCEVKRNDRELELLLKGFRYCCSRGSHTKKDCEFKKNHSKYEFCAAIRPEYFVAVSPSKKISLRLSYSDGGTVIGEETAEFTPTTHW